MLVLSRKKGEKIIIGKDIEICVLDFDRNTMKIGINAPKSTKIYRSELYDAVQKTNTNSILLDNDSLPDFFNIK